MYKKGNVIHHLYYLFGCVFFTTFSQGKEIDTQSSNQDLLIGFSILVLLILILFLTYKALSQYFSKRNRKNAIPKKRVNLVPDDTDLEESKELIDFLKTNPHTNALKKETFGVQDLLDALYGLLTPLIKENTIEFVYDIDKTVPIELVGDTVHLEQVLYTLLSPILVDSSKETVIVRFEKDIPKNKINIEIHNTGKARLTQETLNTVTTLLKPLDATLSYNKKEHTYTVTMPFLQSTVYNESHYILPEIVTEKSVLFLEDNPHTAKVIMQMFHTFDVKLDIEKTEHLNQISNFMDYDIIILDAQLLTPILSRHFEDIKSKKTLHVVSLETFFGKRDRRFIPNPLIDKYLTKPLSKGIIFNLLYEIYVMHAKIDASKKKEESTKVFFIEDREHVTRESFQDFNYTHVLIVEDNKINQKIIQSILEKSSIQITLANNGQEALEQLEIHDNIDIVLMDINMPVLDGYQTTKKIRENEALSSLPIVIVSTLSFRNEIEDMYTAGANAHLTKPFKVGQLYNAFDMFLITATNNALKPENTLTTFHEDSQILDIQKGADSTNSIVAYRDILRETLVMIKYSDEKIKENIIKKDYTALQDYMNHLLLESKTIHATSLEQIINEIRILLHNHEEQLLEKYIVLYRDEWIKTKRHIERYLKSTA